MQRSGTATARDGVNFAACVPRLTEPWTVHENGSQRPTTDGSSASHDGCVKRQLRVTRATTYGLTVHGRFFTLVAAGVNETKKRSPLGERANRPWTLLHASRGWRERNEETKPPR